MSNTISTGVATYLIQMSVTVVSMAVVKNHSASCLCASDTAAGTGAARRVVSIWLFLTTRTFSRDPPACLTLHAPDELTESVDVLIPSVLVNPGVVNECATAEITRLPL